MTLKPSTYFMFDIHVDFHNCLEGKNKLFDKAPQQSTSESRFTTVTNGDLNYRKYTKNSIILTAPFCTLLLHKNMESSGEIQNVEEEELGDVQEQGQPQHAEIIQRNITKLIDCIDIEHTYLYDKLWEKKVFTEREINKIKVGCLWNLLAHSYCRTTMNLDHSDMLYKLTNSILLLSN